MTEQPDRTARDSPADLLGEVVSGIGRLVRGELALAKAEAKRSLGDATSALGKLIVAAILGVTAVNVLSGAAVAGLVMLGFAAIWASVVVGAVLLLLAFVLVQIGLAQLQPSNLAPSRIMSNLRQDAETLKSSVTLDETSRHTS